MSIYFLLFVQGLISFVSPCVLPMVPVYLIYLAANEKQKFKTRVFNLLGFVCGLSLVFVALGMTASSLARIIMLNRRLFTQITGILVIMLGIYYFAYEKIAQSKLKLRFDHLLVAIGWKKDAALADKLYEKAVKEPEKVHFWSACLIGIAFSLTSSPCISPNLSYALLLAANSETVWQGAVLLLMYSLGLAIPFVIVGLAANYLQGSINFFKVHGRTFQKIAACLMIIVGILMLSGGIGHYTSWLKNLIA